MIDFTRAFDSAWERMMIILFRPFDPGKWFVIGLSAFLAGLLEGGNGFNSSFNGGPNFNYPSHGIKMPSLDWPHLHATISNFFSGMEIGLIIVISLIIFAIVLVLILAIYWLGARGQFLFLDNIVRNRGAISWPWSYYSRQANRLFVFYLLVMVASFIVILPILAVALVIGLPLYLQSRTPGVAEITGFILLGVLYAVVLIVLSLLLFIFREFGIPLMFRNGLTARAALLESLAIIKNHPGSVAVFLLLRLAIFIGVAILSVIACCCTCCVAALPYIGTVVLLPLFVYVRCFTLDCLAQFGPHYDVWTVDVPVTLAGNTAPVLPQP